MQSLAAEVNKKHTWTVENSLALKRSHIKKLAHDIFDDVHPTADAFEPFVINFASYVCPPEYVKGRDNRDKYKQTSIRKWASGFGFQLSDADIERIKESTPLIRPTSEELGQQLGLTYHRREKLKLWSIKPCDVSEDEFEDLKREKARLRQARFRRRSGVRTRTQYRADIASKEPWKALGISKATYYRRQKAMRLGASQHLTLSRKALCTQSHDFSQQPNRNDVGAVHAETVTSNPPLHRRNPSTAYPLAQESVVLMLDAKENRQPAPARTEDDNENAILAEAKRILAARATGLAWAEAVMAAA